MQMREKFDILTMIPEDPSVNELMELISLMMDRIEDLEYKLLNHGS